jgi:hypothetical protein
MFLLCIRKRGVLMNGQKLFVDRRSEDPFEARRRLKQDAL